jgi:hypothetical protein
LNYQLDDDQLLGSTIAAATATDQQHQRSDSQTESEVLTTTASMMMMMEQQPGDAPHLVQAYNDIPVLEQTKLPRGGVSVETKAVGRVQVRKRKEQSSTRMKELLFVALKPECISHYNVLTQ